MPSLVGVGRGCGVGATVVTVPNFSVVIPGHLPLPDTVSRSNLRQSGIR